MDILKQYGGIAFIVFPPYYCVSFLGQHPGPSMFYTWNKKGTH